MTANCTDNSSQTWGQYSPFFSVPSHIDASTPGGCELTFGLVLSRHGSRDPTAGKTEQYRAMIERIQSSVSKYAPGFGFIKDYTYTLGADQLTLFGETEMVHSGAAFYQRYKDLIGDSEPFVRAAGSGRVILSAKNFTHGLYDAQGEGAAGPVKDILVISEEDGYNNTMNGGQCAAFTDGSVSEISHDMQNTWTATWVPAVTERLNEKLPGANLSLAETIFMMDLCPFNTVATPEGKQSDFCRLFSKEEWLSYDYYESLDKWYGHGPGNPLGPTQGVGYVNELIARLTGQPVEDSTTTNSTLDSSPDTFPLDRKLYADFSHDNTMTSVYGALGLYGATKDLPARYKLSPHKTHGYSSAWTVPFAGRMYVEKMQCGAAEEEMVRVLINDRVVPLQDCGADYLGRCKLSAFVDSLSFARSGGLWDEC